MKKDFRLNQIIATLILLVIAVFIIRLGLQFARPPELLTANVTDGKNYFFIDVFPKDSAMAAISGTGCHDLRGELSKVDRRSVRAANIFEVIWQLATGLKRETTGDWEKLEAWKEEQHSYQASVFCVPYVKDLNQYLSNPRASISSSAVMIDDGPLLPLYYTHHVEAFKRPEGAFGGDAIQVSGRFITVDSVTSCSENKHQFCAKVSFYSQMATSEPPTLERHAQQDFRVVCWECDALRPSAKAVQDRVLFIVEDNGLNFDTQIGLNGGYMISEKSFGPTSYIYGEDYPGERAERKFKQILSVIEKEQ